MKTFVYPLDMKKIKAALFIFVFSASAHAFKSGSTGMNLLGVSSDGKYASYEVIDGEGESGNVSCEIRFFDTGTNKILSTVSNEKENTAHDLVFQLRKRCWASAKPFFEKYKIEVGTSVFPLQYDNKNSVLSFHFLYTIRQYQLKLVTKMVKNNPEECIADEKITRASFAIQNFEFVAVPGKHVYEPVLRPGQVLIPVSMKSRDCGFSDAGIKKIYYFPRTAQAEENDRFLLIVLTSWYTPGPEGGSNEFIAQAFELPSPPLTKKSPAPKTNKK